MGGQKERWNKERLYEDYKRAKKRGKTRRNARNAARTISAQWSAIADQVKTADKKIKQEKRQGAKKQWRK